jgi:deazaflavin-dependent oxidoreductase (nitroreductase family)
MTLQHTMTDIGMKGMNRAHRIVRGITRGKILSSAFGMPAIELHTIGSKSGQKRATMLTSPIHDEHRVIVIASKGGDDRNPQWYGNLTANPDVEITMEGQTKPYRARTASPEEKAALWDQIVASYKGYAGYQKKTTRDIPVVICELKAG